MRGGLAEEKHDRNVRFVEHFICWWKFLPILHLWLIFLRHTYMVANGKSKEKDRQGGNWVEKKIKAFSIRFAFSLGWKKRVYLCHSLIRKSHLVSLWRVPFSHQILLFFSPRSLFHSVEPPSNPDFSFIYRTYVSGN